ncbi:MAG: restriction endonuclease subunit S [Candidatus Corynebacterium faecigallinarum]
MSARKAAAGDSPYLLPEGWRWAKLGEVAEIVRAGVKPEDMSGDEPYFGLDCIAPGGEIARWTTTGDENVVSNKFAFSQEYVLMGKLRPYLGKIALPEKGGLCSTDIIPIAPGEDLDRRFLAHWLRTDAMVEEANKVATGANLPRISPKAIGQLDIPLPPLAEQRRIVDILDRAQALRKISEAILRNLSELVESEFDRRFSCSLKDVVLLGDVVNLTSGKSLVSKDQECDSPYKVLKISSVTSGNFKSSEVKQLPDDYVPPAEHLVSQGDLLMSRANTAELVGATAYVDSTPGNIALPDKVWKFRWKIPGQDPFFYHSLLSSVAIRHKISELASGSGGSMKNVSKSKLLSMEIPRVDVGEQREYSKFVESVHERRRIAEGQIKNFSDLSKSLQSRAFRGEL